MIINRIEAHGVKIDQIVTGGGIAEKSPLTMQIYADVCNRPIKLSRSGQTRARSVLPFLDQWLAELTQTHWPRFTPWRERRTRSFSRTRQPSASTVVSSPCSKIFMMDLGFETTADMSGIMKELLRIRSEVRAS